MFCFLSCTNSCNVTNNIIELTVAHVTPTKIDRKPSLIINTSKCPAPLKDVDSNSELKEALKKRRDKFKLNREEDENEISKNYKDSYKKMYENVTGHYRPNEDNETYDNRIHSPEGQKDDVICNIDRNIKKLQITEDGLFFLSKICSLTNACK